MVMEESNKVALVVAAHPDDADVGAAGVTALWAREGWEIYYLVCTDGSKGSSDPEMTAERLVPMRREEQRAAAAVAGAKDCFFLDHVDGELTPSRDLIEQITRYIRLLKPYAVLTHSLDVLVRDRFINHSDHRATAQATIDSVYPTARDIHNFPGHIADGLQPHKVTEIYLWGANDANCDIDITDVVDVKIAALMAHTSQFGHREDAGRSFLERWKTEEGRYFERFQKVTMNR